MSETWRERLSRRRLEIGIEGPEYENIQNKEKAILEALSEPFKIDETMWMLSSELAEKTNMADYNELETLVEGLNESGLVDIPVRAVKEFAVRLTKAGLSFLQKQNKSP